MKSLSLYQLTADFEAYLNAETDEEMAAALADITAGQIEVKVEHCCWFLADLEGHTEKIKIQQQRLATMKKSAENKRDRLKEYMRQHLEGCGITKVDAGTFKVSIANNPPALEVVNADLCPAKYLVLIPEVWQPDTAYIKEELKSGVEVPGYKLTVGRSLRIK